MSYRYAAHPTVYKDVQFRSRLEARWAAIFDLVEWTWQYEPIDLPGWTPDFFVKFSCGHSECPGYHTLLIEVKPYLSIDEFHNHPCMSYSYGHGIPAHASAAFGLTPWVTYWEMSHGAGGGVESFLDWTRHDDATIDFLWKVAGNKVQYMKAKQW